MIGDVHLHVGSDSAVVSDLETLLRRVTNTNPHAGIIFNGDLFDLDRVGGEPDGGVGERAASSRVRRVLEVHSKLASAMVDHVAGGGALLFIGGNHDAEVLFPSVQAELRSILQPNPDVPRVFVRENLQIAGIYIQHGHQVDPDAAFFPDTRTAIKKGRLSAFPLASLLTRLLLSRIPKFEVMGDNYNPPLPVLLRVLRDYKLGALTMIALYPMVGLRIVWQSLLARVRNDAPPKSESTSMSSPWAVVRRMYLDRYFVFALSVVLFGFVVVGLAPPWLWWCLGAGLVYLVIPPLRRKSFRLRDVRLCAEEARAHASNGASLVVFGHTHQAFVEPLGDAVYANHGAFSSLIAVDEEGNPRDGTDPPPHHARTFLAISRRPLACTLQTTNSPSLRPP